MADTSEDMREQANAAVRRLREDVEDGDPEYTAAVLAWLDGYAAGHRAATEHAIEVISR